MQYYLAEESMDNVDQIEVYPHRYDMRVFERKVFMYYLVSVSTTSFSVQADVKEKTINLSNLLEQQIITHQMKSELESKARKYQISTYKRQTFVSIRFVLEYIVRMKYKEWVVRAIERVRLDLDNRTKMLTLESIKRNKDFEKKNNIVIDDREEEVQHLKSKLSFLFSKEYQIDTYQSLNSLYDRVKTGSSTKLDVLRMSQFEEEKMKSILNRYQRQFTKISAFQNSSLPTPFRLPKELTSLYIVYTDIEASLQGKSYSVVKVGKTDKSIIEYQSCLYQDYKSRILFKHVYLGIFQKVAGEGDIDKYFHERLIMIPRSKYFIFNYHDAEEETRVSQEFYLLTDEFITKMGELMSEFSKTHKHVKEVII